MTTAAPKQPETFTEASSATFDSIDREKGLIRGVRVLGLKSRNGRRYLREAVKAARPLYEGARVYLDHSAAGERTVRDRWGKLVNVREAEDGGLIADLAYVTSHPNTAAILEAAEKFQDIGLSHDTLGQSEFKDGERVVTEITKVNSVDLVENPATTDSLWEQEMTKTTKKRRVLSVMRENREGVPAADTFLKNLAAFSEAYASDMEEMAMDDVEVEMEMQDEEPVLEGDEAVKAALKQAILAVLNGPDDSAATMKKIKMLMDAGDKVAASASNSTEENPAMEESTKNEVLQSIESLREDIDKRLATIEKDRQEQVLAKMLEGKHREVTDERLRLLAGVPEGERDALVESWPKLAKRPAVSRPRHSMNEPLAESYEDVRSKIPSLAKQS